MGMNSPHGCPVLSTGPLGEFIVKYAWWIGVPCLVIGMYLLTTWGRYPKTTLALFTTLAASLTAIFVLFAAVFPANIPSWSVLIVGFVCFSMGAKNRHCVHGTQSRQSTRLYRIL